MWFSVLDELGDLSDLSGQHVLIVESELCSASFLFAWALQRATHVVCVWEKPLHYQTVAKSLSRGTQERPVKWLEQLDSAIFHDGDAVVLDSLYGLELLGRNVVDEVRRVRAAVGKSGLLVSVVPDGKSVEKLRYEADVLIRLQAIESSDVTGRLSVQRRGKPMSDMVFTVRPDTVNLKRV